jgi:hypothetical protein
VTIRVVRNTATRLLELMASRVNMAATDALVEFGKLVIKENTDRIPRRVAPSGLDQKENSESYKPIKLMRLGHTIPLWGKDEMLKNPALYTIDRRILKIILRPPKHRRKVIEYLRAKGYDVWDVPNEIKGRRPSDVLKEMITEAVMKTAKSR